MMVMSARLVEMLLTMVLVKDRSGFVAVIVRSMLVIGGMAVNMIMVAFISMRMVMGAEAYRPVSVDQVEGSQQCHPDAG